ncbi:uncharacterized protein LOC112506016 [Cynara cardunculus var. scolymus]|uniref:uncharacterized protein LOC112506016 n=1 Tax=Cynara cardunculus var. scolymus TaxID=59895 RepID=UPI000D62998D|nr:uncharacterized protein LOC112506016 [Cynara cardunculus var. scolymus]
MAYRRRQGVSRSSTFKEEIYHPPNNDASSSSSVITSPSSSLASQAIRASIAHRSSSLSSGYANSAFQDRSKEGITIVDKRTHNIKEVCEQNIFAECYYLRPKIIEGITIADKRTHDIKEVCEQNKKTETNHEEFGMQNDWQDARPTNHVHQLKASRDVAIATAAKAKLLLREIKTVEADLAFAKQRSSQLEEENKMLREAREKGDHPGDDDMIRLQLETLLAEKARLAHENSVYIRENSCLREIIEYHKLSMQDVVYLDEGIEEVAEVNPGISRTLSVSPPSPSSPHSPQKRNIPFTSTSSIAARVEVSTFKDQPSGT